MISVRVVSFALLATAASLAAQTLSPEPVGWGEFGKTIFRAPERARHGLVASADEAASRAGIEILKQGGNAVDAAVAVAFALAVTFSEAGNIGGGGLALVRMADGRSTVVDYREQAPSAAHAGMFTDQERWFGYRSLGVPGTIAGMARMHEKFGIKPWAAVLEPARRMAAEGVPLSFRAEATLRMVAPRLRQFPETARIYLPSGRPPEQGDVLLHSDLAGTIATLQKKSWREFYRGDLARRIVADIRQHNGILSFEDWSSYEPVLSNPLRGAYRGHEILTIPPPNWGGVGLLEMLNIFERFPIAPGSRNSSATWHLTIETMRRAYLDRERWYRQPGYDPVDAAELTDKPYAARLATTIRTDRATPSKGMREAHSGSEQTTHFTIVDRWGNIVSNAYTLQNAFGSTVIPQGTGVLISSALSYFSAGCRCENEIGPNKRAIYSVAPTIVLDREGQPWFALGTPGDYTVSASLFQVISAIIDMKTPLREAVDSARIYHRYLPDRVQAEPGAFSPDTAEKLKALGHTIDVRTRPLGDVHAIMIDPGGWRLGWSDGRAGGRAVGY